jgi:thioredoxin 1
MQKNISGTLLSFNTMPNFLKPMIKKISKNNFKEQVIGNKNLSLVKFKTEWSGACQIIHPMYEELSKSYEGQVDFFCIDADTEKELYRQLGVNEIPTILFIKSGEMIDHAVGLVSKNILIAKIENALSN